MNKCEGVLISKLILLNEYSVEIRSVSKNDRKEKKKTIFFCLTS